MLGKLWRNLQPDISIPSANLTRHFLDALGLTDDAKCLRVHKAVDELAAVNRAVLVQNHHRHVFYIGIERVAERDHFDQWREKHEEQRQRIAPDHDEFLEQDCAEAAKHFCLHAAFLFCCSVADFALSVTKTSSSDGPI